MSFLACLYSCFCDLVTCYFTFHSLFYYILTNAMVLVLYCGFFYKLLFYFNNFYFTYVVNAGAVWFYSFLLIFLYFFCILILYDYCVIYLGSYIIYFMIFVCYILSLLITYYWFSSICYSHIIQRIFIIQRVNFCLIL